MTRRRNIASAVAAVIAALVICACSSSASSSSGNAGSSGGNASTSSGAASGTAVTVGVICTCSGLGAASATLAAAANVAQAWAKSVNASGGISGHPVQLTVKDDAGNPGTSTTAIQSLISSHVDVILDLSLLDGLWQNTVAAAKIPVVGGNNGSDPYYKNPDFYPSGQTRDATINADILTAKAAGAKNIGLIVCAEAPQCAEVVAPLKAAGAKYSVPAVYSAAISATAPNYTSTCLAAKQANAGALYMGDTSAVFITLAANCAQQGYNPLYIDEGTSFTNSLLSVPSFKNSLWANFSVLPYFSDNPAVQQMNTVVDKYYPGLRSQTSWAQVAVQAWTGGLLIEKAVQASGAGAGAGVTAAEITKGLDSQKNQTLEGWSPPLTFTAGQPHSVDCWYTARIQDGQPVMVNGGKLTCQNGAS